MEQLPEQEQAQQEPVANAGDNASAARSCTVLVLVVAVVILLFCVFAAIRVFG